jgi:hypothetical protein
VLFFAALCSSVLFSALYHHFFLLCSTPLPHAFLRPTLLFYALTYIVFLRPTLLYRDFLRPALLFSPFPSFSALLLLTVLFSALLCSALFYATLCSLASSLFFCFTLIVSAPRLDCVDCRVRHFLVFDVIFSYHFLDSNVTDRLFHA